MKIDYSKLEKKHWFEDGNGNEVESEDEQKVALEDFKRLLSKIDEKLDIPVKQNY